MKVSGLLGEICHVGALIRLTDIVTRSLLPEGKGTGVGQSISWSPATHLSSPRTGREVDPLAPLDSAVDLTLPPPARPLDPLP